MFSLNRGDVLFYDRDNGAEFKIRWCSLHEESGAGQCDWLSSQFEWLRGYRTGLLLIISVIHYITDAAETST